MNSHHFVSKLLEEINPASDSTNKTKNKHPIKIIPQSSMFAKIDFFPQ